MRIINKKLEKLYMKAADVLDGDQNAYIWFNTPQKVFNNRTPLDYAGTVEGALEVEKVLRRIEHGVYL
jgi:putative toxin-antitoxin system antitoxin component (TIGR02293 family)